MFMRKKIQLSRTGIQRRKRLRLSLSGAVLSVVAAFAAAHLYFLGIPAKSLAGDDAVFLPKVDLVFSQDWQNNDTRYEADAALKAGLDTLALALGSLVEGLAEPGELQKLLIQALDGIPVRDDYSGYVALWQHTVDIHTPPTPDSAGLDFGLIQDVNGHYFVQDMFEKVEQGGGFTDYTLTSWEGNERVARRAYSRPVPGTDYWLMSWRILDREPANSVNSSGSAGSFLFTESKTGKLSGGMLWTGACVSGLALAMAYRSARQQVQRARRPEWPQESR